MIATIAKRFTFDAAHSLPLMPEGHKCRNMHGHTYIVELRLVGPVDPRTGCLVDYAQIAKAWAPLHDRLDHKVLNQVAGLSCPTTEALCAWILSKINLPYLHSVRVYESSTTWCEVLASESHASLLIDLENAVSALSPCVPYET
ncbi:MAG TPA: 6-carboxytetrahydropterin synthase QueD [Galbitalea sp.]|jgi:6-pyruvoyltetrahydropterin/6-carboxytetrahydropterin synthase